MSEIAAPIYPYIEDKMGIPPEIFNSTTPLDPIYKTLGSGRGALIYRDKNSLSIFDSEHNSNENPCCRLRAGVSNQILSLDLKTRHRRPWFIPDYRHPDFFAIPFIKQALYYFEKAGIAVHYFKAEWHEGHDNFRKYQQVLLQTGSETKAASSTWSAQTMAKFGFSEIQPETLQTSTYDFSKKRVVTVMFLKI